MMTQHPLAALRERLLDDSNPAAWLLIADNHLLTLQRHGENFILPADHELVRPILEYYAGDLTGWVKYVKGIRDRMPNTDPRWRDVYDMYRTVEIRNVQRERRERLNRAVKVALQRRLIADDPAVKQAYANRCTQEWTRGRKAALDEVRRRTKAGRVSEDERSEVYENYWASIDAGIEEGEVPLP